MLAEVAQPQLLQSTLEVVAEITESSRVDEPPERKLLPVDKPIQDEGCQ